MTITRPSQPSGGDDEVRHKVLAILTQILSENDGCIPAGEVLFHGERIRDGFEGSDKDKALTLAFELALRAGFPDSPFRKRETSDGDILICLGP